MKYACDPDVAFRVEFLVLGRAPRICVGPIMLAYQPGVPTTFLIPCYCVAPGRIVDAFGRYLANE